MTTSPTLLADSTPTAPPGYKIVNIPSGGKSIPVLVKDEPDPLKSGSSTHALYSARDPMADKTFTYSAETNFGRAAVTKSDSAFATKTYQDPALASGSHFDTPANLPTAAVSSRSALGFDRAYPTSSVDDQTKTASFSGTSTSSYQNRTAALAGPPTAEQTAFSPMADKQYLGPGAQHVPANDHIKENVVISRMTGLPNRDLSVDEVRDLINNDVKPNTDAPPPEPSKALNDPNYKPEPDRNVPTRDADDDKDDAVPPPGMMGAPENTEPLPQK